MLENISIIPMETREFMADEDLKATKITVQRAIGKCFELRVAHLEKLGIEMNENEKAYWDGLKACK